MKSTLPYKVEYITEELIETAKDNEKRVFMAYPFRNSKDYGKPTKSQQVNHYGSKSVVFHPTITELFHMMEMLGVFGITLQRKFIADANITKLLTERVGERYLAAQRQMVAMLLLKFGVLAYSGNPDYADEKYGDKNFQNYKTRATNKLASALE